MLLKEDLILTQRKRIGIYIPGSGSGGPWRSVHSIVKHIDTDEFEVILFCHLEGEYPARPEIKVVNIAEHAPPCLIQWTGN